MCWASVRYIITNALSMGHLKLCKKMHPRSKKNAFDGAFPKSVREKTHIFDSASWGLHLLKKIMYLCLQRIKSYLIAPTNSNRVKLHNADWMLFRQHATSVPSISIPKPYKNNRLSTCIGWL